MGLLLLAITALYAWPRTPVLGAILLTGYLGGAVATHVRIGNPFFSLTLFGIYLDVALWVGLWLRSAVRLMRRPPGLTRQLPTMINHHVPDTQNRPQNRPGSTTSSTSIASAYQAA